MDESAVAGVTPSDDRLRHRSPATRRSMRWLIISGSMFDLKDRFFDMFHLFSE